MHHAVALAVVPNLALNQTRTGRLSMWKGMAGAQGAREYRPVVKRAVGDDSAHQIRTGLCD